MKFSWAAAAVIAPIAMVLIAWGVLVEVRLAGTERIDRLEESMRPIMIDFEVKQELIRLGHITENTPPVVIPEHIHDEYTHIPDNPAPLPPPAPTVSTDESEESPKFDLVEPINWGHIKSQASDKVDQKIQSFKK